MFRLPWAVSLFGAQQLVKLVSTGDSRASRSTLYSLTSTAQETFETEPFLVAGFKFGDAAQRAAVDWFFDSVTGRAFRPEWVDRTADVIVQWSINAVRDVLPGDNLRLYLDSLRNTFAVINLVNNASAMLALPAGPIDLHNAVPRAYTFGEYAPLWLVEGLGEAYANQNWCIAAPTGLLTTGAAADLRAQALLMMHAGMGLAFARRSICSLTPVSDSAEVATALRHFLHLVQANSRVGYEGAALESLGLVTRTWYQALVPLIDEALWVLDRGALEYFWHGVGRAIFFTALLPGANPFETVRAEARHELALLNGTAGCAWAFTLVNIRQPELLLHLISTRRESLVESAFINGLMSTLVMANVTLPCDPYTAALCAYRPHSACPNLVQLWLKFVMQPCRVADEILPILKERHQLGEVFRYRDWTMLDRGAKTWN